MCFGDLCPPRVFPRDVSEGLVRANQAGGCRFGSENGNIVISEKRRELHRPDRAHERAAPRTNRQYEVGGQVYVPTTVITAGWIGQQGVPLSSRTPLFVTTSQACRGHELALPMAFPRPFPSLRGFRRLLLVTDATNPCQRPVRREPSTAESAPPGSDDADTSKKGP